MERLWEEVGLFLLFTPFLSLSFWNAENLLSTILLFPSSPCCMLPAISWQILIQNQKSKSNAWCYPMNKWMIKKAVRKADEYPPSLEILNCANNLYEQSTPLYINLASLSSFSSSLSLLYCHFLPPLSLKFFFLGLSLLEHLLSDSEPHRIYCQLLPMSRYLSWSSSPTIPKTFKAFNHARISFEIFLHDWKS